MIESRVSMQLAYDLKAIWTIITNNQEYEWRSDLKKLKWLMKRISLNIPKMILRLILPLL